MENAPLSPRRRFLALGAGTLLFSALKAPRALAAACGVATPPQTSGPFYPGEANFGPGTDLTRVPGRPRRARGQVVILRGQVQDSSCRPVAGANVEIWQACASGRYNSPKDPNPAPLDPDFAYWGETFTDEEGRYAFKTIIPGAYPADDQWDRPPHVHFRVARVGYRELVTQMYFRGQALNDQDLILQGLPPAERESVIVDFQPSAEESGALEGEFTLRLRSVRG